MDGLYELVLVKTPGLELYQGIFNTFPEIQEWSMNDLYSRHPDPAKSFLYMYQGRKDDIIVLNNGEKIAPALMEATLISHPLVRGAMVVGKGRFEPAVIIDLVEESPNDAMQRRQIVERLQPAISEANIHAPAHGKLDQYHVLFANPKKPISYLGQGKIQRSQTYASYEKDIEEMYKSADNASEQSGFSSLPKLNFFREKCVSHWLVQLVAEITNIQDLGMHQDIFSAGVDSLHVTKMARELRFQARRTGLRKAGADEFLPGAIYKHPTLNQLKAFILQVAGGRASTKKTFSGLVMEQKYDFIDANPDCGTTESISKSVQALFQAYASGLTHSSQTSLKLATKNMTVVLSGSTGSLGSYLLEALYHSKNVSHIICLDRSPHAAERHKQTGPKRGLSPIDPDRVEFHRADLSKPQLGLEVSLYERLRSTVTHIIRQFRYQYSHGLQLIGL